jgi:amino acid permease
MEIVARPNLTLSWFSDIRKVALITFIAAVLGLLLPFWRLTRQTAGIRLSLWARVPTLLFAYLFTAIMPAFYFALYRNQGTLRLPKHLRQLSSIIAIVFLCLVTAGVPSTVNQVANLLSECSNLAYVLLLFAFSRQTDDESFSPADVPVSRFLRFVTKAAVVLYGIWVAFNLVRVVITPYGYAQLRDLELHVGRRPPQLSRMMLEAIRTLLTQACLFIAPYVIYNSWLRREERPEEIQPSRLGQAPS